MSTIFVTGINAGAASVEIRERLAMGTEDIASALAAIDQRVRRALGRAAVQR